MALYDDVVSQQMSRVPGNVLEISVPPQQSKLERYPGETEMGVGVSPAILDLMKQRQRWSPPQDLPPTRVVPSPGAPPAPMPFGFHPLYSEQNAGLYQMLGLPERYHPYAHALSQAANLPPQVISAEASIPHQVLSSVLHPLFRLLFTGTPFSQQNAFTRRFPGFSPSLPGRTAMGALADPAASLATFATEGEVAPEKLFGGASTTRNMYKGNKRGFSLRGTIPGAIYDRLEDVATGTTRSERAIEALNKRMDLAKQMRREDEILRRSQYATGSLEQGQTYAPTRNRYVDPEWNYKDAMRRIAERDAYYRAQQAAINMLKARKIPITILKKK